jgi:hypothetical protein
MPRLAFHPARHGFHFTNLFVNRITPHITTYGLCGGMVLAAARYWQHRLPIPTHIADDFPDGSPAGVPPPGSPLHGYIYDCQMASYGPLGVISAANWITMPWITHEDQFRWSANDEFPRIKAMIDVGAPVVLGLRRVEGGPFGHQVLAYGYDAAAQAVYVYDPNYPDVEKCLRLDHAAPRDRLRRRRQPGVVVVLHHRLRHGGAAAALRRPRPAAGRHGQRRRGGPPGRPSRSRRRCATSASAPLTCASWS